MNDVMKKRMVGATVLVIIGVLLPLLLVRCLQDGAGENNAMRVYEITPEGEPRPADNKQDEAAPVVAANNQASNDVQSAAPSASNAEAPAASPRQEEETPPPPAISPSSRPQADNEAPPAAAAEPPENAGDTGANAAPPSASTPSNAGDSSESLRRTASLDGWVVQVASFSDEANARRMARELQSEFQTFYRAGDVNGNTYYRVRIGPFDSESGAQAVASRLRENGRSTLVRRAE